MSFLSDAAELLKRGLASQRRWPSHTRSHARRRKTGGRRPVPMEIGAYQITDVLGSDGELVFLKAWDEAAARWVRLMAMPLEEDLDATERLERMACLHRAADPLIAVQHENVLRVYGLEYHDGWGCVVAEYLEGVRLSELLAVEETLPPAQVAPLGAALASVMAAAQQVGIEIKGLSSDEIVMTGRGEIKVCSFVCRSESSGAVEAAGERGASGLCTLGALLYRCLTGRQPAVQPPGEKPARRAVTPISAFRPSVPADLERLIMGLMIFDTEEVRLSVPVVAGGLARVAEQHGWTWQAPRPVADAEGAQLRTAEAESEQVVSA